MLTKKQINQTVAELPDEQVNRELLKNFIAIRQQTKRNADNLYKITWLLAVWFIVLPLLSAFFYFTQV